MFLVFDEQGREVADRGEGAKQDEARVYYALYGALDPELLAYMGSDEGRSGPIAVTIWLATQMDSVPKEELLRNPDLAAETVHREQASIERAWRRLLPAWSAAVDAPIARRWSTPMAEASLTVEQLVAIAQLPGIASIARDTPRMAQTSVWKDAVNASSTGVTGSGVDVCIAQASQPDTYANLTVASTHCGVGSTSTHARLVTSLLRNSSSPTGIAPGAAINIANFQNNYGVSPPTTACSEHYEAEEDWCASRYADVWVYAGSANTHLDRLLDWQVKHYPYPFIAVSAGNDSGVAEKACGTSCASTASGGTPTPYSTLIVGGVNDCGTSTRSDDKIWCPSKFANPAWSDRELPEIAAPAQDITANGVTASGTSLAAPIVAGAAAQVISKNASDLTGWPEAVRAILLAGAEKDVHGGAMTSLPYGSDGRDGVGEVNVGESVAIAADANHYPTGNTTGSIRGYGFGTISDSTTVYDNNTLYWQYAFAAKTTQAGKRLRVALTWDSTATCTDELDSNTCSADTPDALLQLEVCPLGIGDCHTSVGYDGTYQFVEFVAEANETYYITVPVYWTLSAHSTYAGVAWTFVD